MSRQKQIFTDPKTGEEIESTWLARCMGGFVGGLVFGIIIGLITGLPRGLLLGEWGGLVFGLALGLISGFIFGLVCKVDNVRRNPLIQRTHDSVARWQHQRPRSNLNGQ